MKEGKEREQDLHVGVPRVTETLSVAVFVTCLTISKKREEWTPTRVGELKDQKLLGNRRVYCHAPKGKHQTALGAS